MHEPDASGTMLEVEILQPESDVLLILNKLEKVICTVENATI